MKTVKMLEEKTCQFCSEEKLADYDSKTNYGPWAYVCSFHWITECNSFTGGFRLTYE